jgi:hypothetical protein
MAPHPIEHRWANDPIEHRLQDLFVVHRSASGWTTHQPSEHDIASMRELIELWEEARRAGVDLTGVELPTEGRGRIDWSRMGF